MSTLTVSSPRYIVITYRGTESSVSQVLLVLLCSKGVSQTIDEIARVHSQN